MHGAASGSRGMLTKDKDCGLTMGMGIDGKTALRAIRAQERQDANMARRMRFGARTPDAPERGYFLFSISKGAAKLPTRIMYGPPKDPVTRETLDRSWRWIVRVGFQQWRDPSPSPDRAGATTVWNFGERITREEYDAALDRLRHNLEVDDSAVGTTAPVDWTSEPVNF